jgi:hypothetical protein
VPHTCHMTLSLRLNHDHSQAIRLLIDLSIRRSRQMPRRPPKQSTVQAAAKRLTTRADHNDMRHSPIKRVTWEAEFPGERR